MSEGQIIVSYGLALNLLMDPDAGPVVADLMAACYVAAPGGTSPLECFGCCTPWSAGREVIGVVKVEFIDPQLSGQGLLAGLCAECTESGEPVLHAAVERDFGEVASMRPIHLEGGSA